MKILFAGSEIGDFYSEATPANNTGTTQINTIYTRAGVVLNSLGDAIRAEFDDTTECWASWQCAHNAFNLTTPAPVTLGTSAASIMRVIFTSNNSAVRSIQYFNGTSWITLGTCIINNSQTNRITLGVKIHATDGFCKAFYNGTLLGEFKGNTTGFGLSTINRMRWVWPENLATEYISEVVITDEDASTMRPIGMFPSAAGAHTDWTGTVSGINEIGLNTSDMILSDTAGQISTFAMSDIHPDALGSKVIRGLVINLYARKGLTGPQSIDVICRIGGVNYRVGNIPLTTNAKPYRIVVDDNPATGAPWTVSELNSVEIGVESIVD